MKEMGCTTWIYVEDLSLHFLVLRCSGIIVWVICL